MKNQQDEWKNLALLLQHLNTKLNLMKFQLLNDLQCKENINKDIYIFIKFHMIINIYKNIIVNLQYLLMHLQSPPNKRYIIPFLP